MCGIAGMWDLGSPADKDLLKRMSDAITHRGPDDEGSYTNGGVGLASRRLSIIDLSTGKQPIHNEDRTAWIVFNGEIYNFDTLRDRLEKKGHRFYTNTDTEAILHLYEEKGLEAVKELNGMFAFAIYDEKKRMLLIARDRLGIKPLNYLFDGKRLLFGSEIKSILEDKTFDRRVDSQALNEFMAFEYVPSPLTMFKGIRKLPSGHLLVMKDGKLETQRYWDMRFDPLPKDERYFEKRLSAVLKESVRKQLVSDVPLGAFLSGGVDSSSVVAMMAELNPEPVKTFTIDFDEEGYGEGKHAERIAELLGTDHHTEVLGQKDILRLIEKKEVFTDEPFTDPSSFPTYLVSKLARKHVTVSLSGDGGDELFAGYDWHLAEKLYPIYRAMPAKNLIGPLVDALPIQKQKKGFINKIKRYRFGSTMPEVGHLRWMSTLTEEDHEEVFVQKMDKPFKRVLDLDHKPDDLVNRMSYIDIKTYLPGNNLYKVDTMSMLNSLEVRVPLLDNDMLDLAAQIPSNLKLNGMTTKHILKKTMAGRLPKDILHRKKQGFSIPMKIWINNELRHVVDDSLSERNLREKGFFDPGHASRIISEHRAGKKDNWHRIWSMVCFNEWHDRYIDGFEAER